MRQLGEFLEEISIHDPGMWENDDGPEGWWAVSDKSGIIAYFGEEAAAYHFRLTLINAKLNDITINKKLKN